jgi:hypothetical protein
MTTACRLFADTTEDDMLTPTTAHTTAPIHHLE